MSDVCDVWTFPIAIVIYPRGRSLTQLEQPVSLSQQHDILKWNRDRGYGQGRSGGNHIKAGEKIHKFILLLDPEMTWFLPFLSQLLP